MSEVDPRCDSYPERYCSAEKKWVRHSSKVRSLLDVRSSSEMFECLVPLSVPLKARMIPDQASTIPDRSDMI